MLILNLKNYPEATGTNVEEVVKAIDSAMAENPALRELVMLAPATYDMHFVQSLSGEMQLIAQHVDIKGAGSTTGWVPAASLIGMGVQYSVLNHSEHRFADWAQLEETVKSAQEVGLKLVVCCESLEEAEKLLVLNPFGIAFEDKDLIGSGNSITTGRPEDVKAFISLVKGKSKAIVGAGVSTGEDVRQGLEFGAEGFILASAFVKATDRKAKLLELAQPFGN